MIGIVVAVIGALILSNTLFKGETSNFIMELPQYRIPTLRSVLIHAWEKVKGFAIKSRNNNLRINYPYMVLI